jgi:hypothetical protein
VFGPNKYNNVHVTAVALTMNDDVDRWPNDSSPPPRTAARWLFVTEEGHKKSTIVGFLVIDHTEHEICSMAVHQDLALMLAYLDLDYWSSPTKDTSSWNQARIEAYLHHVREDMLKELMAADRAALVQTTFGTAVLRQWAIRVYHGYGHSSTGHGLYMEFCMENGYNPYDEEFINYSKNARLHTIQPD